MAVANATLSKKFSPGKLPSTIIIEGSAMISKKEGGRAHANILLTKKCDNNEKQQSDNENEDPSTIIDEAPATTSKDELDLKVGYNENNANVLNYI